MRCGLIGADRPPRLRHLHAARFAARRRAACSIQSSWSPPATRRRRARRTSRARSPALDAASGACRAIAFGRVAEMHDLRVAEAPEARGGSRAASPRRARDRPPSTRPSAPARTRARDRPAACRGPCRSRTPAPAPPRPRRAAGPRRGPSRRRRPRRDRVRCIARPARRSRATASGSGALARELVGARRVGDLGDRAVPNTSSGMSTNVGPRCGVRGRVHAASNVSAIDSVVGAVAACFVTGATIGTWSSSCSEPDPQRSAGARPPITSIGEPLSCAAVERADPVGHARAGGERAAPRRGG